MNDLDLTTIMNRARRQLRKAPIDSDQFVTIARDVPALATEIDALRERVATLEGERGFLRSEAARLRQRVIDLESDPRAGLLEDVAERLGLPRPADERVVSEVVRLLAVAEAAEVVAGDGFDIADNLALRMALFGHDGPTRHDQGSIDAAKAFGQGLLRDKDGR